jgi:transposase
VFNLPCCFLEQGLRSDRHGHDWQGSADAIPPEKSVREIARITSLSRNTMRKWLRAPIQGVPKYRRSAQPRKLSPFQERLEQALTADSHRPKHKRRSARALYAEVKSVGYAGGYSRLTRNVQIFSRRPRAPAQAELSLAG